VVVLPLGTALTNIVFGLIIVIWSLEFVFKRVFFSKKDVILILIFSGYYLFNIFSIFYSENFDYAVKKALLQSYILIFPIIIVTKKNVLSRDFFSRLISFFSLSLSFLLLASLFNQTFKFLKHKGGIYYFLEDNLASSIVDYYFLGLSLTISFTIIANCYIKSHDNVSLGKLYNKYFYLINSFLFLNLILLNSRSLIILTILLIGIIILLDAFKKKKYYGLIFFGFIVSIILTFNFQFNKVFNEKIKEAINYQDKYNIEEKWGGRSMRYLIWDCALKVIDENVVYGTGIGDQQDELTLCYKMYMRDQLLFNKDSVKNAHNIFLQIGLSSGLIGIILFLISFLYPIIKTNKNSIYVYFVVLFLAAGFTESYLERNVSIAFFSFFNSICFLIPNNYENTPST
jgi:O-antigen ligase